MTDAVFVTGTDSLVGAEVVRSLAAAGRPVLALVAPGAAVAAHPGVTTVVGTPAEAGALCREMTGCRHLVHVDAAGGDAAGGRDPVLECASVLEAARLAGVERAVVTVAEPLRPGRVRDGDGPPDDDGRPTAHAWLRRERAALAARLPAVLLAPTIPVGPGMEPHAPARRLIAAYLSGRAPTPGGVNLVDVEDVAEAHLRALDAGRPRERYVIAGEDLDTAALWMRLRAIAGPVRAPSRPAVPARRWGGPGGPGGPPRSGGRSGLPLTARLAALVGQRLRAGAGAVAVPGPAPYADGSKARLELGLEARPIDAALRRAVEWMLTLPAAA